MMTNTAILSYRRLSLASPHVSVCFRCPVMLVVGDQAPYEEAAVSQSKKQHLSTETHMIHLTARLFLSTRWSATAN